LPDIVFIGRRREECEQVVRVRRCRSRFAQRRKQGSRTLIRQRAIAVIETIHQKGGSLKHLFMPGLGVWIDFPLERVRPIGVRHRIEDVIDRFVRVREGEECIGDQPRAHALEVGVLILIFERAKHRAPRLAPRRTWPPTQQRDFGTSIQSPCDVIRFALLIENLERTAVFAHGGGRVVIDERQSIAAKHVRNAAGTRYLFGRNWVIRIGCQRFRESEDAIKRLCNIRPVLMTIMNAMKIAPEGVSVLDRQDGVVPRIALADRILLVRHVKPATDQLAGECVWEIEPPPVQGFEVSVREHK